MNFEDILKDWDKLKKEEGKKAKANPASPKAKPEASPPMTTREQVLAYMNRFGIPDKDIELDQEAEEERSNHTERDRLKRMRPEASIDLHGQGVEAAIDSLRLFLDDCCSRGYKKVLIVHGKGNHSDEGPVMKRAVLKFLETYSGAGRSGGADKESGGSGATWLILKRP